MTCYLLNSPVLPAHGLWRFSGPITPEQARHLCGPEPVSGIGHQAAARIMEKVLRRPVSMTRQRLEPRPGDRAIVLRLKQRLPEGVILDEAAMERIGWELGLLEYLRPSDCASPLNMDMAPGEI